MSTCCLYCIVTIACMLSKNLLLYLILTFSTQLSSWCKYLMGKTKMFSFLTLINACFPFSFSKFDWIWRIEYKYVYMDPELLPLQIFFNSSLFRILLVSVCFFYDAWYMRVCIYIYINTNKGYYKCNFYKRFIFALVSIIIIINISIMRYLIILRVEYAINKWGKQKLMDTCTQ